MAKIVLANGTDPSVKKLAGEIVSSQQREVETIEQWLKAKGK